MRQSSAETLVTEEPYALIAHVRICGGAGRVTAGPTRKPTRRSARLMPGVGHHGCGRKNHKGTPTVRRLCHSWEVSLPDGEHHALRDGAPLGRASSPRPGQDTRWSCDAARQAGPWDRPPLPPARGGLVPQGCNASACGGCADAGGGLSSRAGLRCLPRRCRAAGAGGGPAGLAGGPTAPRGSGGAVSRGGQRCGRPVVLGAGCRGQAAAGPTAAASRAGSRGSCLACEAEGW